MVSLHIDTARTWRGGQSQVFYTVTGLRASGQRAGLVAHPDGELYRRMGQDDDPIPARRVADGIPSARIAIVNEGVDVGRMAALPAADIHAVFHLPAGAPVVGNVAALVPHKGHRHLIDAAALVIEEVPDARFVIIG